MMSREADTVANVTPTEVGAAGGRRADGGWRTADGGWVALWEPRGIALACMALYLAMFAVVLLHARDFRYGAMYSALAIVSALLMSPSRRAAEPPSRRAAEPSSRRVAESPSRRVAESPSRRVAEPPSRRQFIGDFAPLVLMPILYAGIPRLIAALGSSFHDALVQRWEVWVFGSEAARVFASLAPNVALSEVLHAGYLAYYPAIFVPALWLYWRGERRGFAETVMALTLTYAVCWTIFAFFPVQGPRYEWGAPAGVPDGPVRRLAVWLLASGSSRGAAFPSSHMAVSVVQAMVAWRWQRRSVALLLTIVALLVGSGAVYGGFHYGVDMIAGGLLGLALGGLSLAVSASIFAHRTQP